MQACRTAEGEAGRLYGGVAAEGSGKSAQRILYLLGYVITKRGTVWCAYKVVVLTCTPSTRVLTLGAG